jgi:hypothetical protein
MHSKRYYNTNSRFNSEKNNKIESKEMIFFNFRSSPSFSPLLFATQWAAKCEKRIEVSLVIYEFKIIWERVKKFVTEKWSALDGFKKINPDFHRAFIHNIHQLPNFQCRTKKFFFPASTKKFHAWFHLIYCSFQVKSFPFHHHLFIQLCVENSKLLVKFTVKNFSLFDPITNLLVCMHKWKYWSYSSISISSLYVFFQSFLVPSHISHRCLF